MVFFFLNRHGEHYHSYICCMGSGRGDSCQSLHSHEGEEDKGTKKRRTSSRLHETFWLHTSYSMHSPYQEKGTTFLWCFYISIEEDGCGSHRHRFWLGVFFLLCYVVFYHFIHSPLYIFLWEINKILFVLLICNLFIIPYHPHETFKTKQT